MLIAHLAFIKVINLLHGQIVSFGILNRCGRFVVLRTIFCDFLLYSASLSCIIGLGDCDGALLDVDRGAIFDPRTGTAPFIVPSTSRIYADIITTVL